MSRTPAPVIVLQDPYHPYAMRFLRTAEQLWGLRTVAWYTSRRGWARNAWQWPELQTEAVAASFVAGEDDAPALADAVAERFRPVAVVPFVEAGLLPAAVLAERWGLPGGHSDQFRLFRDKAAVKRRLAESGVRVNSTSLVSDLAGMRAALEAGDVSAYVLKPNDGYGNCDIIFGDAFAPDDTLRAQLARYGGAPALLEERLFGPEYTVNGQVGLDGTVSVDAIFRYRRETHNNRSNVETAACRVSTHDASFQPLCDYASAVVTSLGLCGSPFHLEAIVDDAGPCLVEVAARLHGSQAAFDIEWLHGGRLDVFARALADYLDASVPLADDHDWQQYDTGAFRKVLGISHEQGRIWSLSGVEDVEALPQFLRWVQRPRVGDGLSITQDSLTVPWQLSLVGRDENDLDAGEAACRTLLRCNDVGRSAAVRQLAAHGPVAGRALRSLAAATRRRRDITVIAPPASSPSRAIPASSPNPWESVSMAASRTVGDRSVRVTGT